MSSFKGYIRKSTNGNQFSAELLIQSGFWIIQYKDQQGHRQQLAWSDKNVIHSKESYDSYKYEDKNHNQFYFISNDVVLLKQMNPANFLQKWIRNNPAFPSVALISIFIILGGIATWKSLPYFNEKISNSISIETEKKIGDKLAESMLEKESINDTLSQYVNEYYKALDKSSKYDIKITVVNSDIINAYALPGGNIVVYTGILKKMKSHESLAALLGHESTHVEHRHSLKSLTRSLAFSAVIGIVFGSHDLSSVIVSNASKLSGLKYSRLLEEDADQGSISLLKEKKISLQGMVDLMNTLSQVDSAGLKIEFIQTHPLSDKRLETAKHALADQSLIETHAVLISKWDQIMSQIHF